MSQGPPATSAEPRGPGWKIASLGGVPVYIGGGWVVITLLIVGLFGPVIEGAMPSLGATSYLVALVYALLLLLAVLVHEAAHAVTARTCGYHVHRIVADLIGGHTTFDPQAATPGRSAAVAVAGPAANLLLAVVGHLVSPYAGGGVGALLTETAVGANVLLAVVNLLPGLPLDGGHLLDAAVWRVTGRRYAGLIAAGWGGRVIIVVVLGRFLVWPLVEGQRPSLVSLLMTVVIAAFLWSGSSAAISAGRSRRALGLVDPRPLVVPAVAMPAGDPLWRLPDPGPGRSGYVVVVVDDGRPIGPLDPHAAQQAQEAGALDSPASAFVRAMPDSWVLDVPGQLPSAEHLMVEFGRRDVGALVLRGPGGELLGVLDAITLDTAAHEADPRT